MEFPKSWNDVNVDQFIQLKNISYEEFNSILSYKIEQLCILTDTNIDDDYWNDSDTDQLNEIFVKMKWLESQPKMNYQKELGIYRFKELNTLTLGEFIDLEYYFNINYIQKLPEICA